jgi:hypothetical protein
MPIRFQVRIFKLYIKNEFFFPFSLFFCFTGTRLYNDTVLIILSMICVVFWYNHSQIWAKFLSIWFRENVKVYKLVRRSSIRGRAATSLHWFSTTDPPHITVKRACRGSYIVGFSNVAAGGAYLGCLCQQWREERIFSSCIETRC